MIYDRSYEMIMMMMTMEEIKNYQATNDQLQFATEQSNAQYLNRSTNYTKTNHIKRNM